MARDQAPKPIRHVGRTSVWDEDAVRAWIDRRPGMGARGTERALRQALQRAETAADQD